MCRMSHLIVISAIALMIFAPFAGARAVNRVWIHGAGSGLWSTGSNWAPTGARQPGDSVFVTSSDSFAKTAIFDSSSFGTFNQFQTVTIDESGTGNIKLLQIAEAIGGVNLKIGLSGPATYDFQGGTCTFG